MTPLVFPMAPGNGGATNIFGGVSDAGSQATTAVQACGAALVIGVLVYKIWMSRGGFAAILVGGLAAGFAYWLIEMNGLATMGSMWDSTWTSIFG